MISAKEATCAKVEMTKVAQVNAAAKLQAGKEAAAPKAGPLGLVEIQARSLVLHETRDAAILAARALECKPFGAFSFVCRMLRHGGVSGETFGGLPVTVELDGEEDELVPPPPGLEAGADIAPMRAIFPAQVLMRSSSRRSRRGWLKRSPVSLEAMEAPEEKS